jgi:ketosteroid isomerase-like protein
LIRLKKCRWRGFEHGGEAVALRGMHSGADAQMNLSQTDRIKRVYEAFNAGRHDDVREDFSHSFTIHEALSLPYGGAYEGWDGLKRLVASMADCWADMTFDITGYSTSHDHVICHVEIDVVGRRTGDRYRCAVMELWRFEQDRIVEMRPFYWDTAAIRRCAGY